MSAPRPSTGRRLRHWLVRSALAAAAVASAWGAWALNRPSRPSLDGLATATVRRADFRTTLRAGGITESAESTIVECQLERLEMKMNGRTSGVGGSSTILWVIDDGSTVKKGDVLCRLDSSDYEELVLQQEIKVERARSDMTQARLTNEVARMAVGEFRDGVQARTVQEHEVALSLAESDVVRARDRLAWTGRMKAKGYASTAQYASAELALRQAENEARNARSALDLFRRFEAPRQIHALESDVKSTESNRVYYEARFGRFEERLAYYKRMVANCTIRAPHDGFVIYVAPDPRTGQATIEPGARVHQMQDMFILPDLSRMRVAAMLHESVMARVEPGMTVRAKVEGMGGRVIEGHVLRVEPLPDTSTGWLTDAKSFKAMIQLDSAPRGIRPEMTAEVEIDLGRRSNVLAVPVESVAVEGGRDVCYVAADGLLERRRVTLGGSNPDLIEVTSGLEEGEEVVRDVTQVEPFAPLIVDAPAAEPRPAVAEASRPRPTEKAGL